ncbi:MAG: DNA polymerase III subunit epsilon [Steroidobacteraceae bacterium]
MRQIILDTETTGLDPGQGHRIVEIGGVELVSRRPSGRSFHKYLNPERDIDPSAQAVHGLSRERLAREPRFAEVADEFLEFISGAELVIHNAAFDINFIDAELVRLRGVGVARVATLCPVLDTLMLAREMHPGQRNSLDALCKRYGIDNSHRELHGALLDARILADVYLAMSGGQSSLGFADGPRATRQNQSARTSVVRVTRPAQELVVRAASAAELAEHAALRAVIGKASGGVSLWQRLESEGAES